MAMYLEKGLAAYGRGEYRLCLVLLKTLYIELDQHRDSIDEGVLHVCLVDCAYDFWKQAYNKKLQVQAQADSELGGDYRVLFAQKTSS